MQELRDLYQEVILDHSKRPRNYRKQDDASNQAKGYNPLCGDKITVFLKLAGGIIEDVSFDGAGAEAPGSVTILGAWDADVGNRVFANGSGLAQLLLGRRVGDEVELEGRPVTISKISAWTGFRSPS